MVLPLGAAPACFALLAFTYFACSEPSAARDAESDAATSPDASLLDAALPDVQAEAGEPPCTSTFSPDCKHPPVQAKGQPD